MWSALVGGLLNKVAPKVADYYMQKQQLKQEVQLEKLKGKIAWEKALSSRAEASEGRDHEWEIAQIKNSGSKDEVVLALISIPMVGSFIPAYQDDILKGFEVLGQTPMWYQGMIVTIFLAIYGIRRWRRKTTADTIAERVKDDTN